MTSIVARQSTLSWFLDRELLRHALVDSVRRLTPRYQWRNPVLFVVYVGSLLTTLLWLQALLGTGEAPAGFILAISLWLWATLLFANFSEAIAEDAARRRPRRSRARGATRWRRSSRAPSSMHR